MIAALAVVWALFLAVPAAAVAAAPSPDPTSSEVAPTPSSEPAPTTSPTTVPTRSTGGSVHVFGSGFTLQAGEVRDDVQVSGGPVRIDGTVKRDLIVFGGSATINGTVGHNVRVTGGSLTLGPNARVGHDVTVFGGSLNRDPGAVIGHDVIVNGPGHHQSIGWSAPWSPVGGWGPFPWLGWWSSPSPFGPPFDFIPGLGLAVAIVVIGLLIQSFFPQQLGTTGAVMVEQPLAALGVGCATAIAGVLLAILLAITFVLILGSVAIVLGMIAGFLFGWTAIVLLVGRRVMDAFDWHGGPVPALVVGGVLAALVLNVPFLNGVALLLGGALALGAVVLTRFGTRPPSPLSPPR
jgi:hypothetical protein